MALICGKCGSAQIAREFRDTPQERYRCIQCRALDQIEGQDDDDSLQIPNPPTDDPDDPGPEDQS